MRTEHWFVAGTIIVSLLLSACGGKNAVQKAAPQEQRVSLATFDYKKAAAAHSKEKVIRYEALMLQDFKERRAEQLQIARSSFASIKNLQYMQQLSKMGYLEADMQTRMAELRNVEKEKLTFMQSKWMKEANAKIATRRQDIESEYQLELFNLRIQLENARLKPAEVENLNKRIAQKKQEREQRLAALFHERDAYIKEQAEPYLQELDGRLAEKNSQLLERNAAETKGVEQQYDERLKDAPQALARAMQLLDQEIARLERRQVSLSEEVGRDVLEVAKRVAAKHSCELSLVKQEHSLDITEEVLHEVKMTK